MMRIKEGVPSNVLVEKFGFRKEVISHDLEIYEYTLEEKYSITLIQRGGREIYSVIPGEWDTDCAPISDVVFKMILDGLVESTEK